MTYPGDLVLRPGRRVCRVGDWVKPELISGTPFESVAPDAWVCGELVSLEGSVAYVEGFGVDDPPVWAYPADRLEVAHDQEKMTDPQYYWALLTIQERIRSGLRLVAIDSTTTGDKYTYCSWGFHDDRHAPEDIPAMWPIGMPRRQDHQCCPLDDDPDKGRSGCFYRCLAFQKRSTLTQRRAVSRYTDDIAIALEELHVSRNTDAPEADLS